MWCCEWRCFSSARYVNGKKSSQSEGWGTEDVLFTRVGVTEAASAVWNTDINWDGCTTVSYFYFLIVLQMFERQIKEQAVTRFYGLQFKSVGEISVRKPRKTSPHRIPEKFFISCSQNFSSQFLRVWLLSFTSEMGTKRRFDSPMFILRHWTAANTYLRMAFACQLVPNFNQYFLV